MGLDSGTGRAFQPSLDRDQNPEIVSPTESLIQKAANLVETKKFVNIFLPTPVSRNAKNLFCVITLSILTSFKN